MQLLASEFQRSCLLLVYEMLSKLSQAYCSQECGQAPNSCTHLITWHQKNPTNQMVTIKNRLLQAFLSRPA